MARISAIEALGNIGPEAAAAVPSLIQTLKDEYKSVRSSASKALEKINPEAAAAAGTIS
jgi:HEAT repeat protein